MDSTTPYEVAQAYAAGQITRDELVETLTSWTFVPEPDLADREWHEVRPIPDQSFRQVVRAFHDKLIDLDTYEYIRSHRQGSGGGD